MMLATKSLASLFSSKTIFMPVAMVRAITLVTVPGRQYFAMRSLEALTRTGEVSLRTKPPTQTQEPSGCVVEALWAV